MAAQSLKVVVVVLSFFSFSLVSATGSEKLTFMAVGDWGGLPDIPYFTFFEAAVARQMGKVGQVHNISFILSLGDHFYFDGVKNVSDQRFKESYEDVFTADSLQKDWYLIAGNHDHNGNVSAQISYSQFSKRWNYPDYYYTFTKSIPGSSRSVRFIMIDTVILCGNTVDGDPSPPKKPQSVPDAEKQWEWIESTLSNSKEAYVVVGGHFPVYSVSTHGPTPCLVQRLLPLLQKYNATTYLCGHDHNIQHLNAAGMDYFVSGMSNFIDTSTPNAGSVPSNSLKFFWSDIVQFGGFLVAEAGDDSMVMTFVSGIGQSLHRTKIRPRH